MSKINRLRVRHWSLSSHGALKGKSTFIASNCRAPIVVVDTDGRFDAVEALVDGDVIYPSQVIDPLTLAEELMELCLSGKVKSIAFDSLTKLYSIHARMAYMRNISGRGGKSRASEMVHKANAMTIARDMAMLGTDMYYSMHTMAGVDGQGKSEIRSMISEVERSRLQTSINVTLEFIEEAGDYGVRVATARDFGGRPANTGFVYWDAPGNYWRGAGDWIEKLIYTSFSGKPEAVKWVSNELGIEIDEADGVYENIRESADPKEKSDMWVALVTQVHELSQARTQNSKNQGSEDSQARTQNSKNQGSEDSQARTGNPPAEIEKEPVTQEVIKIAGEPERHPEQEKQNTPPPPPPPIANEELIVPPPESPPPIANEELIAGGRVLSGTSVEQMRTHLKEVAEKRDDGTVLLGQVVYAILEATQGMYPDAGAVVARLSDYPDLPEGYTWELDKIVTTSGGMKFFDFVVGED